MPGKEPAKRKAPARRKKTVLLSGGNPQIAKGYGDAPVQAYIDALSDWKRDACRRIDELATRSIPSVTKAVKWNSPFYGIEGQGWIVSYHVFTKYIKVTFFAGSSLKPVPPGGKGDERWIDVHEDTLDETQLTKWLEQSAKLPGWVTKDIAG
jgi:hypothetical protein